jgi:hypothetical protein
MESLCTSLVGNAGKNKKENHRSGSPDHQGASISHTIAIWGEGCHPFFYKDLMNSMAAVNHRSNCQKALSLWGDARYTRGGFAKNSVEKSEYW